MWRVFVLCFAFSVQAQLIENQTGQAFTAVPFFNQATVAQLKIQSIEGFYTYKTPNSTFKESSDWFRYRFNEKGQLIEQLEIIQNGKRKDSTLHQYAYNPSGLLHIHRYGAYGGAISEHYQYDSLKRLIQIIYYRDQFSSPISNSTSLVMMRKEILNYATENNHNYTQYNQYNLPFMDVTHLYNKDGYLIEKENYFRMSQQTEKEVYKYGQKGELIEKSKYTSSLNEAQESCFYSYDQWGNLIEVKQQKKGQATDEIQVVYDYKTGYLGAVIRKNALSNELKILRFTKYTYFK